MSNDTLMATLRVAIVTAAVTASVATGTGIASADSTDDYPIPNRMLKTTCTVDQYMAAARDTSPIYYERYITDYNNRPVDVEDAARERISWFFSLDYAARRQYSEDTATNVYYEQVATRWGNWAKLFFNNKGVVAKATDACSTYPAVDPTVWQWGPNQRPA